jgi:hypothetical protein
VREVVILFLHLIVIVVRLARPGGLRSVVAESILAKHQLLILNRGRKRAPNLRASDRIIAGLCTLFIRRARVFRSAIVLKPSTLLRLHDFFGSESTGCCFRQRTALGPAPRDQAKISSTQSLQ